MYCECETSVVTTVGETDGMKIDVGLHQGSALSPFLFILVLNVITENDLFLVLLTNAIGAVGSDYLASLTVGTLTALAPSHFFSGPPVIFSLSPSLLIIFAYLSRLTFLTILPHPSSAV